MPHQSLLILADVGGDLFHIGDEAMLEANLERLRRQDPAVQVTVVGRDVAGVGERLGVAALAAPDGASLADARLPAAIAAALDEADGLFLSGGGNLCSSWPDLLRQRIVLLREARKRGLPIVTGGQTIGPELTPVERSALADVLATAEHVGARELPSAALALQMGVPPQRLSYQPDDTFFFAGRPPAGDEAGDCPDEPFLAITLDPTFAAARSRATLQSLAIQLARMAAELGLQVVFLPHVGPLGRPGNDDGLAGAALCQLLQAEGAACTLLPVLPPAPAVWVTQRAALVVSSRYHPLVFATAAAVPCLGIHRDAYTRIKLQGALAHVGMDGWCLPVEAAEAGGLATAIRSLWDGRGEAQAEMTRARAMLEVQEERRWHLLLARLGRQPEPAEGPEAAALGWPADRLAAAALAALVRERQAGEADAERWRAHVNHLERSIHLAGPFVRRPRRTFLGGNVMLAEQQWNDYSRDGFLHLGKVLEPEALEALKQRADDLALGHVKSPNVQMQLDTGGAYEELPAAVDRFERGTMLYRKIQGLETDEQFSLLVRHPLFLEVCARQYGPHAPVSIFRAMVMNKPAGQGTILPWHQDGGDVWALDRDPLVTIWVALDPATQANGCMEIVPGTHRLGLLSTFGSTVREEDAMRHCLPERVQPLEVEAGHAVLLHNWLIHRSGVNPTPIPRRAFTACYMDGRTQSILTGSYFPLVAGTLPAEQYPFVRQVHDETAALREGMAQAEAYARSLEEEVAKLRQMRDEAERYAKSLEAARQTQTAPGLQAEAGLLSRLRARLAAAR